MSIWTAITGLFRPAKELVEVFKPNAEQQQVRKHLEQMAMSEQDMASLQQFAAEFYERKNRTWWDSLVDGLNRLPRPLITVGVLAFFVLAPYDPLRFLEIAKAYEVIPDGFWALLGVIIAFYFGGRMQVKSQDMAVKGHAVQAAKDLIAMRREFRDLRREEEPPSEQTYQAAVASGATPMPNRVIEEWKRRQQSHAAGA
jgi:hypothetical protein